MLDVTLFENKSAQGTTGVFDMWSYTTGSVYVVFGSGVTGGTVVIETAHDRNYQGTWAQVASVAAESNKTVVVTLYGAYRAVRARIASAIQNGTVSCYACAYR